MDNEETINKIFQSKELTSIPQIDSYEIKILNAKRKVINSPTYRLYKIGITLLIRERVNLLVTKILKSK